MEKTNTVSLDLKVEDTRSSGVDFNYKSPLFLIQTDAGCIFLDSGWISSMHHTHLLDIEPSSVICDQTKYYKSLKYVVDMPNHYEAKY